MIFEPHKSFNKMENINLRRSEQEGKASYFERIKDFILSFFSKHKRILYSAAGLLLFGLLFKKKVFDKMIPSSDIMQLIHQ